MIKQLYARYQKIVEHYEASISKMAIDLCFPLP